MGSSKTRKTTKAKSEPKHELTDDEVSDFEESDIDDEEDAQSGGETEKEDDDDDVQSGGETEKEEDEEIKDEDDEGEETEEEEEDDEVEEEEDANEVEEETEGYDDDDGNEGERVCHMKHIKKSKKSTFIVDDDDSAFYSKIPFTKVVGDDRITDRYLTFFEVSRIIGTRAQQFNKGAIPLIKGVEGLTNVQMAFVEMMAKMTPCIVRRHLPNKKYEDWELHELENKYIIDDEYFVPKGFDINNFLEKT